MIRVTEAIAMCGLTNMEHVTQFGLDRGTAVHKATQLHDAGCLDESTVHEAVAPFLQSWKSFRSYASFQVLEAELPVVSREYNYRGTLDRVLMWSGDVWIIDLKCGDPAPWHRIQTALYAMAYRGAKIEKPLRRGTVYLCGDGGTAKMKEHVDRRDYAAAVACVALANWKVENEK